jgi:uncharacterized protein (DUF3084 family)
VDIVSGLVVLLLVLLSGIVAALGDWLGRRLGKKRLRIAGLRPKHTAIVTTFFAGMLITLVTIVILSLLSEQVRQWLVEGADVQRQLQEARGDLKTAEGQVEKANQDVADVRKELEGERARLAEEQAKVAQATKDAAEMRSAAESLRGQVASLNADLKRTAGDLKKLDAEYAELRANRDELQASVDEFYRQQQELFQENNRLLAQNEKLGQDITRLEQQIQDLNKSAEDAREALRIAEQNFQTETSRISQERQKALNDLGKAQTDLSAAQRELTELRRAKALLETDTGRARFGRLIYNRGDELARLPVRSMLSQAEARSHLMAAMEMSSRDALAHGATESQSSDSAAVFAPLVDDNGNPITPEMQFQRAIEQVAGKDEDQIVIVRSLVNAFNGETVWIMVEAVPNPIVYQLGDFIIETRIDGRRGVQGVTEALVTFIGDQLRERAVRDGMVPAIGRPAELGEVTQEQIQQIVTTIVESERTVTVRFHAAKETRAGDPLTLDIRLR